MIAGWAKDRPPVALVTGASRGIGAAVAQHLYSLGVDLVVVGRDRTTLKALTSSLDDGGLRVVAITADLLVPESIEKLAGELPPIDILINSAGAIHGAEGWKAESRQDITATFDLNYSAALRLSQVVAPKMIEERWGRIVNLTSIYGRLGSPYVASYSASKAALLSLTRSLAIDLGPAGITVNCISPGNIETDMTLSAGEEYINQVTTRTPVGRLGHPDEVARTVQFLVESPFINGAEIVIDGGLSLVGG